MMASIVNVVIEKETGGGNDRRIYYSVTLEDNQGVQSTEKHGPVVADASFDEVAHAQVVADQALAGKADAEESEAEGAIEDGESLARITNARWAAGKRIARRVILRIMREQDPRLVIALEPVIQYLQSTFTAAQIANYLGITTQQVLRLNRRVKAILTDTGTVKAQLAVFEGEAEDIGD